MSDKRTINHIIGRELEEYVYNILSNEPEHKLTKEVKKIIKSNSLNIIKKGGRQYNYDLDINGFRFEIKNNSNSIKNLPEILQITFKNENFIHSFFNEVICKYFKDITLNDYEKDLFKTNHEGVFSKIYSQREIIENDTKIFIEKFLSTSFEKDLNKTKIIENIIEKLKEQTIKYFILFSADRKSFKIEKLSDSFNSIDYEIKGHYIIIHSDNTYKCLLRFKNGIGCQMPSLQISLKCPKREKTIEQQQGIFFTPYELVIDNIGMIIDLINDNNFKTILEPSCGNGSFINVLKDVFPESYITGIELNENIFKELKELSKEDDHLILKNENYLKIFNKEGYDLIIGNPPFYVLHDNLYKEFYIGRPNIFIQFIIHSLKQLKQNGVLSFIIPSTFLNCQYYEKTRRYIIENFTIINIKRNDDIFKRTKYNTITIIIQNKNPNDNNSKFVYKDILLYSNSIIHNLLKYDHFFLEDLNIFKSTVFVSIGDFVWNQHKDILSKEGYKVICSINQKIKYINEIPKGVKIIEKPFIIIPRGYGMNYKFDCSLIIPKEQLIIENHLIIILTEDFELLKIIYDSLKNEKTIEFIKEYVSNGALNINDIKNNICLFI